MANIEEQELDRLKQASANLREARTIIADIEISLYRLESKKKSVLFNADQAGEELTTIQEELQAKYGDVVIDLSSGEIKE